MRVLRWIGGEITAWSATIAALVMAAAGLKLSWLTPTEGVVLAGAVTALSTTVTALRTRPVAPTILQGLVTAGLAVGGAYGFHLTGDQTAAVAAVALVLGGVITRMAVSPLVRVALVRELMRTTGIPLVVMADPGGGSSTVALGSVAGATAITPDSNPRQASNGPVSPAPTGPGGPDASPTTPETP
jgi:cell division protein FtsW (lipid II flippase)